MAPAPPPSTTCSDYIAALEANRAGGGFNFDNYRRNQLLLNSAFPSTLLPSSSSSPPPLPSGYSSSLSSFPPIRKTGTTICGVVCKDAVVLGADTRATEGSIVADKNCCKLHAISSKIYCAGAGVSADLEHTTAWLETKVELHRLNTSTEPRVSMAVTMLSQELFMYQGYKQCAVVLGGVDIMGPSLYKVHPHGSTDKSPFASMGSGSLSALAVLEKGFSDNMSVDDGKALVASAIRAGIFNDLGSGGNVDLCVLMKEAPTQILRAYDAPNPRPFRMPSPVAFAPGTTEFLRQRVELVRSHIVVTEGVEGEDALEGQ